MRIHLERYAEALWCFDRALALAPAYLEALVNQAHTLNELKRYGDAIRTCDRALALDPACAGAFNNRGIALAGLDRHADALACYDRALQMDGGLAVAHNNRGNALFQMRRFEEAVASYTRAAEINPLYAEPLNSRGRVLAKLNRHDEALTSYAQALAVRPDFALAHFNESLTRLALGQLGIGWQKYEWRWKAEKLNLKARELSCPLWLGREDLRGKSILLHADQGLGDAIQFVRYAALISERGATVYLDVMAPLRKLLERVRGVDQVLAGEGPPPRTDFHCPLSSLPLAFGTTLSTIPASIPYLALQAEAVASWRSRLVHGNEKLVGICWRGSPLYKDDAERSIEFDRFAALLSVPGIRFVSLQKELTDGELALAKSLPGMARPNADFTSTAEIVAAADLVITVDTVWAHCAGALGRPVWVLLPFSPHWVWLTGREDSPWYPTARLFRQSKMGDWEAMIGNLKKELARWRDTV